MFHLRKTTKLPVYKELTCRRTQNIDHADTTEEYPPPPMVSPATAQWGLSLSKADFQKLIAGHEPQSMDDHWRVDVSDPDQSGVITISIAQSWGSIKCYVLSVKPDDGVDLARIDSITWEQDQGGVHISEEKGKKDAVILCRHLLECEFVDVPDYDFSDLWDHPAARLDSE